MRFRSQGELIGIAVMVTAFVLMGICDCSGAYDFSAWEQGAAGYEKVEKAARDAEDPLILYFYTKWCGYCQKLEKEYLSSADVRAVLTSLHKVAINPEQGPGERTLQSTYAVRGFPAFMVAIPSLGVPPARVHPFLMSGSMSTAEFSKAITVAIARQYNNKGATLLGEKKFDQARIYLDKALAYYADDPNLHYNRGLVYYELAQKPKDLSLLAKAEESYRAALKIDGGHQKTQQALARVKKSREQWKKENLSSSPAAPASGDTSSPQ